MKTVERDLPASFVRGGTSKGLVIAGSDLPADSEIWAPLLLAAMGSPDPYGRQLNGMGGGLSSLSKVCVVFPPTRADIDVEYTFAQVQIHRSTVDFSGNCGNMSAAIGPAAIEMGLVALPDGPACIRMLNRNTNKVIAARFEVAGGRPMMLPHTVLDGVEGPGTEIMLDFIDPGGAATGKLLPTGNPQDRLVLPDGAVVEVSLVDASNPCVFIEAASLGLTGSESPSELEADAPLLMRLESIRRVASVRMGIAKDSEAAAGNRMTPLIAVVSPPQPYIASDGKSFVEQDMDLAVRFLSNGQPHRAVPATGAMSTAAAALVPGSIAHRAMGIPASVNVGKIHTVRVAHPSGCTAIETEASATELGVVDVVRLSVRRTMRRLFTGVVHVPMPEVETGTEGGL